MAHFRLFRFLSFFGPGAERLWEPLFGRRLLDPVEGQRCPNVTVLRTVRTNRSSGSDCRTCADLGVHDPSSNGVASRMRCWLPWDLLASAMQFGHGEYDDCD